MSRKSLASILSSLAILAGCATSDVVRVGTPLAESYVSHGRELVIGVAACGFCHGERPSPDAPLTGGQRLEDKFGGVRAPNLTPAQTDLAAYEPVDYLRSFRAFERKDERGISREIHRGYEWMSDPDTLSVIAYLESLSAAGEPVERRRVSFLSRNTKGFMDATGREVTGYVPDIDPKHEVEYGRYLVDHVARCTLCHNTPATLFSSERYLGGGSFERPEKGEKPAPSLGPSTVFGIGDWTEKDIVEYLRTGRTKSGSASDSDYCPVEFYAKGSDRDLNAIAAFLKSLSSE